VQGSGIAHGGIQHEDVPIGLNAAPRRFDVPTVASGKISAALTWRGDAAGAGAGRLRVAGGEIGIATFAIRNGVLRFGGFVFENSGLLGRRESLFFGERRDFRGVGFGLRRFRRLLFVEALREIDGFAFGDDSFSRHRNASGGDQTHSRAPELPADAAPGDGATLEKGSTENSDSQKTVKDEGVEQVIA